MPVTAFGSDLFSTGRAILLLTDLTSQPQPDIGLLRIAFGLTAAEARLAATLASGMGLTGGGGVPRYQSRDRAKQLKSVFAKTGTRRQAELTGLMMRLRPFDLDARSPIPSDADFRIKPAKYIIVRPWSQASQDSNRFRLATHIGFSKNHR